jgi:tetratricopeptide (TPR) repeat protein
VAEINYLEFDLEIRQGSGREYPVAVLASPAGQAQETMRFPFTDSGLESRLDDLQSALFQVGGKRGREAAAQEQTARELGQELFDALFSGEVGIVYDMSRRQAAEEHKGLRLRLRIGPPEMAAVPWEFLYDSRPAEFICLPRATPLIRYLELPRPVELRSVSPPLRILGMVASPPDLSPLNMEGERRRMEEATRPFQARHLVDLKWLEGQTWRDLRGALWRGHWHVLHLIGHGGVDQSTGESYVVLTDDGGKPQRVSAARLSRLLASRGPLRLVVLSTGLGDRPGGRARFSSTATMLVQRGLPAVLTMEYGITEQAASTLAKTLYEALATAAPVDHAVAEARMAIYGEGTHALEWGSLALYSHSPELCIFDTETLVAAASRRAGEALAEDRFERAIDQYALAAEMGADPAAGDKQQLAREAQRRLQEAEKTLNRLSGRAEPQADALIKVIEDLETLGQRLPEVQAIQVALERGWDKASGLRDRLWKRGQRLLRRRSVGLTLAQRRRRVQKSVRLLQKASRLDREEQDALKDELGKAMRRLEYLQAAQARARAERGRRRPIYGIAAALLAVALVVSCLVLDLVPLSTLVARTTPTATPAASHTPKPIPTAPRTAVPTAGSLPSSGPTQAAAPSATETASPAPTETATATLVPSSTPSSTATRRPTSTPTPLPSETPTVVPRTARPSPSPSPIPTVTPSPGIVYAAPVLLQPADIVYLSQYLDTTYTMRWAWDGTLGADEWFDVRVWQAGGSHQGIVWTKQPYYVYDICLKGNGDYYWSVAIVRGRNGQWLSDLSPEAQPRRFTTFRSDTWCRSHGRYVMPH